VVSALLAISLTGCLWTAAGGHQNLSVAEMAALSERAATLLELRCLACHNPQKRAGGIDLTTRESAVAAHAFVVGDAGASRMVRAVSAGKMPPDGRLPEAEVILLTRWIEAGATYPRAHLEAISPAQRPLWSFQPLKAVPVPHSRFDALSRNPVDRFLFATLQRKGLRPSPPADRRTLLRRASIDLTGLPPTPEEIRAFLADRAPNAYEKVVDRLLASPAYGERWGRHWLDVVRYGESHGYEQNHLRPNAWPYRDYVIRAFNQDKPYDRFVTEQLAGDIVGKGDPDAEVATGFLVAGIHDTVGIQTEEGTRQQRSNDLDDIVSTTGATFLGLTVNCAKCHDHKFDPIPARDYYRLAAVFADVHHGERPLSPRPLSAEKQARLTQIRAEIQSRTDQIGALEMAAQVRLLGDTSKRRPAVNARHNVEDFSPVEARYVRFTVLATSDGSEPCLDELQVFAPGGTTNLALASRGAKATASSLLPGYPIHQIDHLNDGLFGNSHSWISNEPGAGWAQIELPAPARIGRVIWERDADGQLTDRLATAYRVEVSIDGRTWTKVSGGEDRIPASTALKAEQLVQAMTPEERRRRERLAAEIDALRRREAALMPLTSAYIGEFTRPDPTYFLARGDVMQRGEVMTPGALSRITTLPSDLTLSADPRVGAMRNEGSAPVADQAWLRLTGSGVEPGSGLAPMSPLPPRLALARWICDARNPLTARVMVNRVWENHFGHGIVDTPSDFGNIGSPPSHPELLDWLANDFMAHGWRLKRLHRMLVTSYAYRQTSAVNAQSAAKDSENRLLWRMPLRRMEAEAVRDSILAASGKLNRTMGGPGYPLFQYNVVNVAIYTPLEEQGPQTWRRGVYQIPARGIRDDLLGDFDCPDSSERTPRRTSTTTALQALTMLNGRFVSEQAEFLADRAQREAGSAPQAQMRRAFLIAFGRNPTKVELQAAASLVARYGLPTLCRALFNANEFLYY
jgi:hypothetical protein